MLYEFHGRCPKCESEDVDTNGDPAQWDCDDTLEQYFSCDDCGADFVVEFSCPVVMSIDD